MESNLREKQFAIFAKRFANRCIHCRDFHLPDKYCFQIRFLNNSAMAGSSGKRKRKDSSSEGSDTEDREVSDGYDSDEDGAAENTDESESDALRDFYSKVERIDEKDITLSLSKRSEKLYFSTVLGRGKFDREGREKIRDKYYLSPKQFAKFNPPDLMDTRLHIVESMVFSGLSLKLQKLHGRLRDVSKVALRQFESLAAFSAVCLQAGGCFHW